MKEQGIRSKIVARRTYNRPLNDEGTVFETWEQTIDRVIGHQTWLWERAKGKKLNKSQLKELSELRQYLVDRKVSVSGRTLWLGGTDVAKKREASQFNCSFLKVETVHDIVDAYWLLMQGCGVGFRAENGILNGFAKPVTIKTTRSTLTIDDWNRGVRGDDKNKVSSFVNTDGKREYHLVIGDSAEAWSKAIGKVLALKDVIDVLHLDYSQIRASGVRLRGYGWISSGDETLSKAMEQICGILNRMSGKLLSKMDIHDVMNWLGTTLSSRRSAEISLMDVTDSEAQAFALAKKDHWIDNPQRAQSNNSVIFYQKPSKLELRGLFNMMLEAGGSEPGFINGEEALRRAPWFKGLNPCSEILLGNRNHCNLVEINLKAFNGDFKGLLKATRLIARANYRQSCVNLDDGVLQRSWHELNQFLHLTGVGITGIVSWEHLNNPEKFQELRRCAIDAVDSIADELGLPRSKLVCTVKPSGSLSKVMETEEGCHLPLGKYIMNNINLSKHDPLVETLRASNYDLMENPYDSTSILVKIPVEYDSTGFTKTERPDGTIVEVNQETAVDQLNRYKMLMDNYVDHNCSITVSYDPDEVPSMIDWLYDNWNSYVGVSFLFRNDPTKTAESMGFPYLPQEVTTKEAYDEYVAKLLPVDLDSANSLLELEDDECAGGVCPVR